MSLRMFELRRLAVLSFALLAFGAAPALADEDVSIERAPHHVRMHRTYYHPRPTPIVVRQTIRVPVPVVVPQPYPVPLVQEPTYQAYYVQAQPCGGCGVAAPYVAPAPVYSGCGGCGGAYVAPAPVYSGCGGCGGAYVTPAPVYSGCGGCGARVAPQPTSYCADDPYDGQCTTVPTYAGAWPYGYRSRGWLRADRSGCAWAGGRWYCR